MKRLMAVLAAAWLLCPAGWAQAAQTTNYHLETASARADIRLFMLNDTEANYLSDSNGSDKKHIGLGSGYVISTSIDFELVHHGRNLTQDLNFTSGGVADFTIWLKGSKEARGMRLGAEVGAGNGTRSCGRQDRLINLGTAEQPFDVPVTLNSSQLEKDENLRVTIYIDYLGLPMGMPLALDIVTGGNTTSVVLPVENFARLVMDLSVDERKQLVHFRSEGDGPFSTTITMNCHGFHLTGPTTPRSVMLASVPAVLVGYWQYGLDGAKAGRYTFNGSCDMPSGQILEDSIVFELPAADNGLGGGTMWFIGVLGVMMVLLPAGFFILRRRARNH